MARTEKGPVGCPIGPGPGGRPRREDRGRCPEDAYCAFTDTSSRTNEVASEESSVPVNFSVIVLPM
jgi:hypothetical protein